MDRMVMIHGNIPGCSQGGCLKAGTDGYCEAGCCIGLNPRCAYCSEHSHRPARVLEILGHAATKESFTRDEVRRIVMSMWAGAGLVYESAGHFEMLREMEWAESARATQVSDLVGAILDGEGGVGGVGP